MGTQGIKTITHNNIGFLIGIDKTYSGIDHYVLDVEIPEVANLFKNILVELF
ncbi:MAG: hypothetical protein ACKO11_08390 [Cuspidothrix sp.]